MLDLLPATVLNNLRSNREATMNNPDIRESLATIVEAISRVLEGNNSGYTGKKDHSEHGYGDSREIGTAEVCTPKMLPKRLLIASARTARTVNPANAPAFGPFAMVAASPIIDPMHIAVLTQKYWGPKALRLTVSFMEQTAPDLRARVISNMNAWNQTANVSFVETQQTGDVRISRGDGGYWSYLGTDILHIPKMRQTMNLQGFTMDTPDSEYKRVIRHETGHTLGFPHEHMRKQLVALIDPQKAYDYFLRTQGWDKTTVDQQVLTALDDASIMATPPDQDSIMCYQLPREITKNGLPIRGGLDINPTDFAFAGKIYPKGVGHALASVSGLAEDWAESEDILEPV
jgi:hypothetical protein